MKDRETVLRHRMVRDQIRGRGIRDPRLLRAMEEVPRHLFVEGRLRGEAYADNPLPIGYRQTISQPYMVAAMTECLRFVGGENVLEVGTGSGYQAAILARLARHVYTIERVPPLAARAREVLRSLVVDNVEVIIGDGSLGLPEHAPYDVIVITAGVHAIPDPLLAQLAEGGRLAAPVGVKRHQILILVRLEEGRQVRKDLTPCVFVPLIGKGGWEETSSTGEEPSGPGGVDSIENSN